MLRRHQTHNDDSIHQLVHGLYVQARVIRALMMKDALSRFGHENLGFFWVIGEPLILTSGIMILWSILHITHGGEVDVIPFALTGYSFLTLWRHVVSKSVRSMQASLAMKYHRQVALLDIIISRALLETLSIFSAFIVAYLPLGLLGFCPIMADPLNLVIGFALTGWFSFSFGLVLAGISELNEPIHHLIPPLMYITLPLTGAFTMQDWLPDKARDLLAWSPLVNCIEMIRSGLFSEAVPTHFSSFYVIIICIILHSLGLMIAKYSERSINS